MNLGSIPRCPYRVSTQPRHGGRCRHLPWATLRGYAEHFPRCHIKRRSAACTERTLHWARTISPIMLRNACNLALLLFIFSHANRRVLGETIDEFKIRDRNTGRNVVAEVKDGAWVGRLNIVPLYGRRSSLMADVKCNGKESNFDGDDETLDVTRVSNEDPPVIETGLFQDHVHLYAKRSGTARVVFSWFGPGNTTEPECTTPPIDVHVPDVETFEILDRGQDRKVIAYAHGDHWHYDEGPPVVGTGPQRGSYSANIKCDGEQPDFSDGSSLNVVLAHNAPEFVETESHGDHVHIRATENGQTEVVFSWQKDNRVVCSVPNMRVTANTNVDNVAFRATSNTIVAVATQLAALFIYTALV